jgi:hypothetical protein
MFEHYREPVLPRAMFLLRLAFHAGVAVGIVIGALAVGIIGYHTLEGLSWIDAIVNAAMILGGMGPIDKLHTTAGKLFAAGYALFSGLVFLVVIGVLFAPIIHRFLHKFHLELDSEESEAKVGASIAKESLNDTNR